MVIKAIISWANNTDWNPIQLLSAYLFKRIGDILHFHTNLMGNYIKICLPHNAQCKHLSKEMLSLSSL